MGSTLHLLLVVTLIVTVYAQSGKECLQKEFRAYTHCIKKREAVQWCSASGCTMCEGNNCVNTCKGFSCGLCPNGSCCDSTKCNACYGTFCCSTASCNHCIRACRDACTSDASCEKSCIPQCENDPRDVFVIPSKTPGKPEVIVYIKGKPYKGNVTEGQIPTKNKTATVSIDGVDHPATILLPFPGLPAPLCQPPCNISSCTGIVPNQPCNNNNTKEYEQNRPQNYSNLQQGCCHVVHPQQCYMNNIYPYQHCSVRSHKECSNLCSSNYVHLTPQPQQRHQCHYIRSYPYVYCGQHSLHNCDSCYVCNGQYNPSFCSRQTNCSNVCKQNLVQPVQPRMYQQVGPYPPVQNTQFGARPFQYG